MAKEPSELEKRFIYNNFFVVYSRDVFVSHITAKTKEAEIRKKGFLTGHDLQVAEKRKAVFFADLDVNYGLYARNQENELYAGEEVGKITINIKGLKLLNMTYKNSKNEFENYSSFKAYNVRGELDKIPFDIDGTISYLKDGRIYEVALKKDVANKLLFSQGL